MSYTIEIKRSAEKEMDRLPDKIHKRISDKILTLETDPRPPGTKKLQGEESYRLWVEITGCFILSMIRQDVSLFTALPTGGKPTGK